MNAFLQNARIQRQLIVPHTPEQNSLSEQQNSTLIVCTMPPYRIVTAIIFLDANDIRNRCVSQEVRSRWISNSPYNFSASLLKNLACSVCGEKTVNASIGQRNGLCLKVTTKCESCNSVLNDNYTSPKVESANKRSAPFLLNRKIAEAINNIGLGNAALEKICANLCIKSMSSRTYRMHLQSIIQKILVFCRESFNRCSSFCKTSLYK